MPPGKPPEKKVPEAKSEALKTGNVFEIVATQSSRILGILAIVFIMAIMVLTVADVLMRAIFNSPISGSIELCQYFIVVGGFLGLAWCTVKGAHVRVDMLVNRLRPRAQLWFEIGNYILALAVAPLVTWRLFAQGIFAFHEGVSSATLEIPAYPFYVISAIGYGLFSVIVIISLVKAINKVGQHES
jgi:TRAP-type transport system small permease protein